MSSLPARIVFRVRAVGRALVALLRTIWWRLAGMQIGRRTLLPRVFVTWPHQVSLGVGCNLEHNIYFKYDGIWAPGPSIVIGNNVFIGAACEFNIRSKITIADDCLIASGCRFIDHDHDITRRDVPMIAQVECEEAPITIADDVWLGVNVIVLKGVTIGRGAIVGAAAVVTRDIGPYEIWAGVPARKIAERS